VTDDPEALVCETEEAAWNRGDLDVVDEAYAADFVLHTPMGDRDRAGTKEMIRQVRSGTSDFELRLDEVFAAGDRVVMRYTMGGTNTGPSFLTEEPTGESWTGTGISIYRVEDGAVAEQWDSFDYLGVMRQLGLLPSESSE